MFSRKQQPGTEPCKSISRRPFFGLVSVSRLAGASLILILLVGSTGAFVLSNYKAYAQYDGDADGVDDASDPCIDPNDLLNLCASTNQQFSGGQQQETGGEVSASGAGDEQYRTSTGDEQYGTSMETNNMEQVTWRRTTVWNKYPETNNSMEQVPEKNNSMEQVPEKNNSMEQVLGRCLSMIKDVPNFVSLDCGAGTNTQGSPAPIKPQFAYLVQGESLCTGY